MSRVADPDGTMRGVMIDGVADEREHIAIPRDDGMAEVVTVQRLRDGQPIPPGAEVVRVESNGAARTIKPLYRNGPAKVTSDEYRAGWETTFAGRKDVN